MCCWIYASRNISLPCKCGARDKPRADCGVGTESERFVESGKCLNSVLRYEERDVKTVLEGGRKDRLSRNARWMQNMRKHSVIFFLQMEAARWSWIITEMWERIMGSFAKQRQDPGGGGAG